MGTVVYLTDSAGRRYDPLVDPEAVRLDTRLQPGESVIAMRRFVVAADARWVSCRRTKADFRSTGSSLVRAAGSGSPTS